MSRVPINLTLASLDKCIKERRRLPAGDVALVIDEARRLRQSFDAIAAERDRWLLAHDVAVRKVATYSGSIPRLLEVVDVALLTLGQEHFVGRLLLALKRGLEELDQVNNPPVNTCEEAPANPSLDSATRARVQRLAHIINPEG